MQKIDGKEIARKILEDLKNRPVPKKFLAAVLVGNDPASENFVKQKEKTADELGVDFRTYRFDENSTNDDLREEVGKIAGQKPVGGIIVQLPLPENINRHYVLNAIPREKDVDVLGERALGAFYAERNKVLPPAVAVVEEILKITDYELRIADSRVAVVGLGFLVGKPLATWLMGKAKEIYLVDKGSDYSVLKNADLVISGAGQAGLIKPGMLKDGASVIDFGYGLNEDGKLSGDFDSSQLTTDNLQLETSNLKLETNFYTPTPGGTGPILVAKLFQNFYTLNEEK